MKIGKTFEFDSAHKLPKYDGLCRNLHGHTYKLEVVVERPVDIETGMVMDFAELKNIVEIQIIDKLDHKYLNDIFEQPTAEKMAIWIYHKLEIFIDGLHSVKLWETPTSWVKYENK